MSKGQQLNCIDLFCGCGGLSKGFLDAGFRILVGVDNNQPALDTFKRNHQGRISLNADQSPLTTHTTFLSLPARRCGHIAQNPVRKGVCFA